MAMFRKEPSGPVDFKLGNGEDLNRQSPRSFFIPTQTERQALQTGDLAKLLFEVVDPEDGMPTAERMWVQVLERQDDEYVGSLDNQPNVITTIQPGDRIRFGAEHVIATFEDAPMLALRVIVSRRSHDTDTRPNFVYRDSPMSDSDSGWCVLVGDETQEELDDPDNCLSQQMGFVLDRWPELGPVFETGAQDSEWQWDESTQGYLPITPQP